MFINVIDGNGYSKLLDFPGVPRVNERIDISSTGEADVRLVKDVIYKPSILSIIVRVEDYHGEGIKTLFDEQYSPGAEQYNSRPE